MKHICQNRLPTFKEEESKCNEFKICSFPVTEGRNANTGPRQEQDHYNSARLSPLPLFSTPLVVEQLVVLVVVVVLVVLVLVVVRHNVRLLSLPVLGLSVSV